MRVSVRFQSSLSRLVGTDQVELSLPEPACLADLTHRLEALYPQQAPLLARAAYMVDNRHAAPESALADGAQVLALMLLSGG